MKTKILQILRQNQEYVSGQELCELLGVSRTTVWKAINQLKEAGYEIEAVSNRGYRMLSIPDILSQSEIESVQQTKWAGHPIYYYAELDSTNTQARRQGEEGAAHGAVIVANTQTAGRGRRGRTWNSPKDSGLFYTMLLKPQIMPSNAPMLTLVQAMAAAKGIRKISGLEALIKWPNDIVINGKKVAGILTEMSAQIDYVNYIVVGTGINVHQLDFPKEIVKTASSIDLSSKENGTEIHVSRAELLNAILEEFEVYYEKYIQTQDLSAIAEEYNQLLVNKGRQVRVLDPIGEFEGQALGINPQGELLVKHQEKIVKISSGEVSVRGIYGYV